MRQPITRYDMRIYKLKANKNKNVSDLDVKLKPITFNNLKEISDLRSGTRYKEYKKLLRENKSIGVAAYYKGKVIGYGWGKLKGAFDNFYYINEDGYIAGIYVSPNYRGHNIATVIIEEIMKKLYKEREINVFYASIEKNNIASKHAFQKIGMQFMETRVIYRICKITVPKRKYFKEMQV